MWQPIVEAIRNFYASCGDGVLNTPDLIQPVATQ